MSFLDRVIDSYKFLDKNGLKSLVKLIKSHDYHWTGTHAEYEAQKDNIPAYAILHFTDDYDENVQVGVYSTEETKTGEIWIDNRPIYRKVFVVTNTLAVAGTLNIPTGVIGGIDRVVNLYGTSISRTTHANVGVQRILPFGHYGSNPDAWACNMSYRKTNNDFILQEGASISDETASYTFTVEYTKTTD